jgi:hypothetical protein
VADRAAGTKTMPSRVEHQRERIPPIRRGGRTPTRQEGGDIDGPATPVDRAPAPDSDAPVAWVRTDTDPMTLPDGGQTPPGYDPGDSLVLPEMGRSRLQPTVNPNWKYSDRFGNSQYVGPGAARR